jgi:hypothetical protein
MDQLRWFMGRPDGLNLRNLCWHGFLKDRKEWPYYAAWIWNTMIHMGIVLKQQDIHVKNRERVKKPMKIEIPFQMAQSVISSPTVIEHYKHEVLRDKNYHHEGPITLLEELKRASIYLEKQDWLKFYYAILPLLEYLLRILYVSTNNLPLEFFRAETFIYHTILDHMLKRNVLNHTETTRPNELYKILPLSILVRTEL